MVYINAICHPGLAELPQVQASQRAYWGTAGRGSAHIEGRTSRDALDHLYWINDLKGNDEKRGARQCFALIPKLPDPVVLKYGERLCSYAFLIV